MKQVAHGWVGLMALERLRSKRLTDKFDSHFKKQAKAFVRFFDKHKDAFVQGAWFPDTVISDNLAGGHTYKLKEPDPSKKTEREKARRIKHRPPAHLSCRTLIDAAALEKEYYSKHKYTLPDRCEALTHAIRDMMRIQGKEPKGSDIMFSDDQITLYFLMLSHYIADAHVPPHSDARDLYGPATVHPDMEKFWDDEIKKHFTYDRKRKVFDYDVTGAPEVRAGKEQAFDRSVLGQVIELLEARTWNPAGKKVLGKGNSKVYDYLEAVCLVSYALSTEYIPLELGKREINKLRILEQEPYLSELERISPHILADAIDSTALVWLLTWDKLHKLEEGIKKKKKQIRKSKKKSRKKQG